MGGKRLVVAALVVDDLVRPTRVLAARRSRPPQLAGRWEFPGGKVEPGEEPTAALVRELAEELGLSIEVGGELVNPAGPPWPISDTHTLRCWFARIVAGHPAAGDSHDEVRWLAAADLDDVAWLDADRPIADLLLRRLQPARS